MRIFMAALTGIRRLVLRVDPEFHRLSLEHLDIRYFLATVGLHADEEGLVNLGDLVLEVDSSDDFRMVGCENILFVVCTGRNLGYNSRLLMHLCFQDNVSQWLEMKNREKKLPCLKRITIVFHLRRCTISWNDVEFVMGSPSSIADQVQEGYTFCSFAADIQDNFLPTIADIKKAFKRFQKPHRQIEELDVQVRLAPSEEDRDLLMDNPPFLHVHGKFRPDGTTDYLANSRTDAWEKSREGDMRIAFEEYKKISSEFQERLGELEMQVDEELLGDDGDYA